MSHSAILCWMGNVNCFPWGLFRCDYFEALPCAWMAVENGVVRFSRQELLMQLCEVEFAQICKWLKALQPLGFIVLLSIILLLGKPLLVLLVTLSSVRHRVVV